MSPDFDNSIFEHATL